MGNVLYNSEAGCSVNPNAENNIQHWSDIDQ